MALYQKCSEDKSIPEGLEGAIELGKELRELAKFKVSEEELKPAAEEIIKEPGYEAPSVAELIAVTKEMVAAAPKETIEKANPVIAEIEPSSESPGPEVTFMTYVEEKYKPEVVNVVKKFVGALRDRKVIKEFKDWKELTKA